jgi:hypothetical protein
MQIDRLSEQQWRFYKENGTQNEIIREKTNRGRRLEQSNYVLISRPKNIQIRRSYPEIEEDGFWTIYMINPHWKPKQVDKECTAWRDKKN